MKNPYHILSSAKAFGEAVRKAAKKKDREQERKKMKIEKLDASNINDVQKDFIVTRFINKYPKFSKGLENLSKMETIDFFDSFIECQHSFVDFMHNDITKAKQFYQNNKGKK